MSYFEEMRTRRLPGKTISLLINFNVEILKDGIKRVILKK